MAGRGVLPPGDGSHQGRPAASGSFRQNAISGSFRQNPSFVMAGFVLTCSGHPRLTLPPRRGCPRHRRAQRRRPSDGFARAWRWKVICI